MVFATRLTSDGLPIELPVLIGSSFCEARRHPHCPLGIKCECATV
jgi:hypothetical protein